MPRTPDGHPDLHGYWTSLTFTPLERPAKYGNREFLTEKEPLFEYDCSENDNDAVNILEGARILEKRAKATSGGPLPQK